MAQGNPKIDELKARLQSDPKSRMFLPLAEELRKGGQLDEARKVLNQGIAHHPSYLSAWVSLGRVQMQDDNPRGAVDAANRALKLDPENIVAARLCAEAYLALGEKVEAIKKFKLVLAFLPSDQEVQAHVEELERDVNPERNIRKIELSTGDSGEEFDVIPERASSRAYEDLSDTRPMPVLGRAPQAPSTPVYEREREIDPAQQDTVAVSAAEFLAAALGTPMGSTANVEVALDREGPGEVTAEAPVEPVADLEPHPPVWQAEPPFSVTPEPLLPMVDEFSEAPPVIDSADEVQTMVAVPQWQVEPEAAAEESVFPAAEQTGKDFLYASMPDAETIVADLAEPRSDSAVERGLSDAELNSDRTTVVGDEIQPGAAASARLELLAQVAAFRPTENAEETEARLKVERLESWLARIQRGHVESD